MSPFGVWPGFALIEVCFCVAYKTKYTHGECRPCLLHYATPVVILIIEIYP